MEVRHHAGSYPIEFGSCQQYLRQLPANCFVVTDKNVESLIPSLNVPLLALPPGEPTKSLIWLEAIASWLVQKGASRKSRLIALGGGVIGDLVGFAAASYMRGVPYSQVPTTLLAQVDSSVGGKVAVDIPSGKNLVGAFYPPDEVVVDIGMLQSLSTRQFRNGLAEVWKYGFIMDVDLLRLLATGDLARNLEQIVRTCIAHKSAVVEVDEFEKLGIRATLNYGHTIGHAIEQATSYSSILHGEAISIGMVAEAELGERIGVTERGTAAEVERNLQQSGLPTRWETSQNAERLVEVMKRDKKSSEGNLNFSLLSRLGECKLIEGVPEPEVLAVLRQL